MLVSSDHTRLKVITKRRGKEENAPKKLQIDSETSKKWGKKGEIMLWNFFQYVLTFNTDDQLTRVEFLLAGESKWH